MLGFTDLALIVATTLVCTVVMSVLALVVLRVNRRGSIGSHFFIVIGTAVASLTCSTVAISAEMYLSQHDLTVLIWVIGISTVISLAAAWTVARGLRTSVASLTASARRIGQGDVVDAEPNGVREFAQLSSSMAEASALLAAARSEIEQLDAARRQFIAWISHDLRTPLAGVQLLAEALEEGGVEDPLDYIRRIRVQTDTLNRMVDDLFELSKIQSGSLQLRREAVDLFDIVSDAVADVRPLAAAHGIKIAKAGVSGHMMWVDPHELNRVVTNLLTNAVRYAPQGSEIVVSAQRSDDDRLVLSVLDHGSGVASEDLGRMFDVGWRASTARTPRVESQDSAGAGLGLAIVRGIVEAHGGEVGAEHVLDGFRLNVVLPFTEPPINADLEDAESRC